MHDIANLTPGLKCDASCAQCGRNFVARTVWQSFCSARCRQAALRVRKANGCVTHAPGSVDAAGTGAAKIIAVRPSPSEKVQQNQQAYNASQPGGRGCQVSRHVLEAEVFGGRVWKEVVSSDGVVCLVSTWRKRTLVAGGAS